MSLQLKTARLTVLLDPARKQAFERVCRGNDMTPSQVLRHLIREFLDANDAAPGAGKPARKAVAAPGTPRRANARGG